MTRSWRLLWLLAILPAAIVAPQTARAGGMYLLDRGARPLSRGGAFVAGADDPNALWYNPAGLDESRNQVFSDFTINFLRASFRRYNEDGTFSPKVNAKSPPFPLGALAVSHNFGLKDFTFAAGFFAPNGISANWPRSVPGPNGTRDPAPTRYSMISGTGSALAYGIVGLAYHGIKGLSLGADVHLVLGRFHAETAQSGYDGVICPYPEESDCDSYTTLTTSVAYAATGGFGIKYRIEDKLRLGASIVLPYALNATGKVGIQQWPSNPAFRDAQLSGNQVELKVKFPAILRAGIEYRPAPYFRMEFAGSWEQWSRQQSMTAVPKQPIFIHNVVGLDTYEMGRVSIDRHMRNAWSVRFGYELDVPDAWTPKALQRLKQTIRGGIAYERGAFSNSTLTPAQLDSDKIVLAAGNSFSVTKRLRFEGTIGYVFMADPRVRDSRILLPSGLRPAPNGRSTIGNGDYNMSVLFIGGGFTVRLD